MVVVGAIRVCYLMSAARGRFLFVCCTVVMYVKWCWILRGIAEQQMQLLWAINVLNRQVKYGWSYWTFSSIICNSGNPTIQHLSGLAAMFNPPPPPKTFLHFSRASGLVRPCGWFYRSGWWMLQCRGNGRFQTVVLTSETPTVNAILIPIIVWVMNIKPSVIKNQRGAQGLK